MQRVIHLFFSSFLPLHLVLHEQKRKKRYMQLVSCADGLHTLFRFLNKIYDVGCPWMF